MLTFAAVSDAAAQTLRVPTAPKFAFAAAPDAKHTRTCNSAQELMFGDMGRCLGSL